MAVLDKIQKTLRPMIRSDADKWITVHPHNGTGSKVLIGEGGEVKAGMGGKFNGQSINMAKGRGKKPEKQKIEASTHPSELPSGHEQRSKYFNGLRAKGKSNNDIINQEHGTIQKQEEALKDNPNDLNVLGQLKGAHLNLQQLYHEEGNNLLANEHKEKSKEIENKREELKKSTPKIEKEIPKQTESKESKKEEFKQSRNINEGIPEGFSKITQNKFDNQDYRIVWENENSYGIPDPNYMGTGYYAQHRWAKGGNVSKSKYIFLPKSQVVISGEGSNKEIAGMSNWIAKEKGFNTEYTDKLSKEIAETKSALMQSASERYDRLIQYAKQLGIKGARSGMKTSTILDKIKESGNEPPKEYQEGGKESAIAQTEIKYRSIPGKGNGVVLNVPFDEKDSAKELGARWSADLKKWYFPEGAEFPEGLKKYRADDDGSLFTILLMKLHALRRKGEIKKRLSIYDDLAKNIRSLMNAKVK